MPRASDELLTGLLKEVSRSFYLTLRVLPGAIRPQIGLGYLLARTTDTIADTEVVPLADRLQALEALSARISGERTTPVDFTNLSRHQGRPAERALLARSEELIALLTRVEPADRHRIREVLHIISSGQELDLQRFASASVKDLVALPADAELDDYTYRVAGCVGEFWTRMCRAHLLAAVALDEPSLLANGVRFGKGLQLVNILRDLPADLRQGRCYVPRASLAEAGLRPEDLLKPGNELRFRPLFHRYLDLAGAHLAAGWDYTNAMPYRFLRLRLACAWPILIGAGTLRRLRSANVLDAEHRVKISRGDVREVILRSVLSYPFPTIWRGQFVQASRSR